MQDTVLTGLTTALKAAAPFAVLLLVFGSLERRFPAGRLKSAKEWVFNLKLAAVYLAVPILLSGAIGAIVTSALRVGSASPASLNMTGAGMSSTVAIGFLSLLIFDFFYYWWHRAQHEVKALWAMHKLHHMDETLGVSTHLRCHWLEELGRVPFIFVPMALLFGLPRYGGYVALVYTAWTAFIHANLRLSFGKASAMLAGPQLHRVHHSRLPHHADKNYASLFPIYDVLFGSYYHPARDEYPPTGVFGEPEPQTVSQAFMLPFVRG